MNPMLEQIASLPGLIREITPTFDDTTRRLLTPEFCRPLRRLFVTGCGDSHHAALATELAFESLAGLPVEPQTSMQLGRYAAGALPQDEPGANLVIGISVSGEVSRTYEAMQLCKKAGATTLALTSTPGSRIASAGDVIFPSNIPLFPDPEGTYTPGVRSYIANQVALHLMAVRIGEARGVLSADDAEDLRDELLGLANAMQATLEACLEPARSIAEAWVDADEYVFLGAGPNYATALFSAAKVLEASGDRAMGQETEEWAHLQYFARANPTPTFLITAAQRDLTRAAEVAVAAKAVGRRVALVAPPVSALLAAADEVLPLAGGVRELFSPLVACLPGMLFAAERAEHIGEPYFRGFLGGRSKVGGGGISRIRTSAVMEDLPE